MDLSASLPPIIDILCRVVDNHGDAGTAWRLCREISDLSQGRLRIRLFIDDPATLMPLVGTEWDEGTEQRLEGIEVIPWSRLPVWRSQGGEAAPWVIEMFGCDHPDDYRSVSSDRVRLIINLEYFSCETWARDCHLLESKRDGGIEKKYFFMPGLDVRSGGIMSLSRPAPGRDATRAFRSTWLGGLGLDADLAGCSWMSVYTYQTDFGSLLDALRQEERPWVVWVFGPGNHNQVKKALVGWHRTGRGFEAGACTVLPMPFLRQTVYDGLLAVGDWALVRGEDSFAGALLSGHPFLWQLYPQAEGAHRVKLEAFLELMASRWPDSDTGRLLAAAMRGFNFPADGLEIDWGGLLALRDNPGGDLSLQASFLRESCNLTQKLLEFSSRFFQGDIT